MNKLIKSFCLAVTVLFLASCGGGGGGSSYDPAPQPTPAPTPAPTPNPMEASLLSTTIDGSAYDVIQISNANSGSTPGGNADAAIKTVYVYTPDGVDNGVATYEGTVWPYVTYSQDASTIVVPDSITATFTVNSESHVLINNQPCLLYTSDAADE